MAFRIFILLLISISASCQTLVVDDDLITDNGSFLSYGKCNVYILAGQSNIGLISAGDIPGDSSKYMGVIAGVNFYNPMYDYSWRTLNVGYNTFLDYSAAYIRTGFGPEASLGYNLKQYTDNDIYIIKYGKASTSLNNNWLSGSTQFTILDNAITDAIDSLLKMEKIVDIKGFVWMQGENDAITEAHANAYYSNLTQFFINLNSEIADIYSGYSVPVDTSYIKVIGRIGTYNYGYQNTIRAAQKRYCDEKADAYMIDTDSYTRQGDGVHLTALSQLKFGWDCFNILK